MNSKKLKRSIYSKYLSAVIVLGLLFFLPAGSFSYWQAWIYSAVLLIPMFFASIYFLKHDPKMIERRMRIKEKQSAQKWFVFLSLPFYLVAFILPGLDFRFGWSNIPVWLVLTANALTLLSYYIFIIVMKENSFASRIIEVEKGQKVISTGPYAIVRHPMYSAAIILFLASPIALGSWWALIPLLLIPPLIIYRLLNEEKLLHKELSGYTAYTKKVKYRLIPYIW